MIVSLDPGDYTALLATGNNATDIAEMDNTVDALTLTSNNEVWALKMRRTGTGNSQTLDLAGNTLTLGSGGLLMCGDTAEETITDSVGGGKLIFGGDDVIIRATGPTTIDAAIDANGGGTKHLSIVGDDDVKLTGIDHIGTYGDVLFSIVNDLELGGPSDRTIGSIIGDLDGSQGLTKSGSGTLTINGGEDAGAFQTHVMEGTIVMGHPTAIVGNGWGAPIIHVYSNATFAVAAGVNYAVRVGDLDFQEGCIVAGDGKFGNTAGYTFGPNTHLAAGMSVGQLTFDDLTLQNDVIIDWELGAGTNTPGTDYDHLLVEGNFTLPASPAAIHITVTDLSGGATDSTVPFEIMAWTGANPISEPDWSITSLSPTKIDVSAATVTVDTINQKIILSGMQRVAATDFFVDAVSLAIDEDGGSEQFTVVLTGQPTNDVVFNVTSDAEAEATVDQGRLTFDAGNWDTRQTVTVTGVDDGDLGNDYATVTIALDPGATGDTNFLVAAARTVNLTLLDDDATLIVIPTSLIVAETNGTATFTVRLAAQPLVSDVVVDVVSDAPSEATVDQDELTFSTGNWATPQVVTVTGQDDISYGVNQALITVSVDDAKSDDSYDSALDRTVTVTLVDDESIVKNNTDSDPESLRDRVANVPAGTTITFLPNIGDIVLTSGRINVTKSLAIQGPGPQSQVVNGNANDRIFEINIGGAYTNVTISGLTLTNGNETVDGQGGAIRNYENLTLSNCVFVGNTAVGNSYGDGGGVIWHGAETDVIVKECEFINNVASNSYHGGAIMMYQDNSSLAISDSRFERNLAAGVGGCIALYRSGIMLDVADCVFTNNAADNAGVLYCGSIQNTITVTNSVFANNRADLTALVTNPPPYNVGSDNGVMYLTGCEATFSDCAFTENSSEDSYGVFYADNTARHAYGTRKVRFEDCTFTHNSAGDEVGVGGVGAGGYVIVERCTVAHNAALGLESGGYAGVFSTGGDSMLTIIRSCIYSNSAIGLADADSDAGALYIYGLLDIYNSTLSGNECYDRGGAIIFQNDTDGRLKIHSSTIYGNRSLNSDRAGVYVTGSGKTEIFNSIIAGSSGIGGSYDLYDESADNFDRVDHCIYERLSGTIDIEVSTIVTNPMVASLADNGGPSLTHTLAKLSPGVDAGPGQNELRYVYPDMGQWLHSVTGITGVAEGNTDAEGKMYLTIVGTDGPTDEYTLFIYEDEGRAPGDLVGSATWTQDTNGGMTTVSITDEGGGLGGSVDILVAGDTTYREDGWDRYGQYDAFDAIGLSRDNTGAGVLWTKMVEVTQGVEGYVELYRDGARAAGDLVAHTAHWFATDPDPTNMVLIADNGSGIRGYIRLSNGDANAPISGYDVTLSHCSAFDYISVLQTEIGQTDQRGTGYARVTGSTVDMGSCERGSKPPVIPRPMMLIVR